MKKKLIVLSICILFSLPTFSSGAQEIIIGCVAYKYEDPFISGIRAVISDEAEGKAKVIFGDGLGLQLIQNGQLDDFFEQGVNSIIVNVVDRSVSSFIIEKAKFNDVPLVFINREPYPSDMYQWPGGVYYVGSIASDSGYMQGEIIADYWLNHPEADLNGDGIMQYVMLKGESGNKDTNQRTEYSIKAITDKEIKIEKVAADFAHWNRVKGQELMTNMLTNLGDDSIEVVISNNDEMALGAIDALKTHGYFFDGKYIPIVGCDASSSALKAIEDDTLLGTVLNDSFNQGQATFSLAYALAQGITPTDESIGYTITNGKYVWIPYVKVTKNNYLSFYDKSRTL
jgi:methyl-galactoside transport system substrate-binding protein